jgi:hypothetical protein
MHTRTCPTFIIATTILGSSGDCLFRGIYWHRGGGSGRSCERPGEHFEELFGVRVVGRVRQAKPARWGRMEYERAEQLIPDRGNGPVVSLVVGAVVVAVRLWTDQHVVERP